MPIERKQDYNLLQIQLAIAAPITLPTPAAPLHRGMPRSSTVRTGSQHGKAAG